MSRLPTLLLTCAVLFISGCTGSSPLGPSEGAADAVVFDGGTGLDSGAGLDSSVDGGATLDGSAGLDSSLDGGALDAGFSCVSTYPEPPKITLPKDEARHADMFEWWYWTGHLETAAARSFGFQLTFFESTPNPTIASLSGTMAHFGVTDVLTGVYTHDYQSSLPGSYTQKQNSFRVSNGAWWAEGANGSYTLHSEMNGYTLDLALTDAKRAVLNFGDGYTAYPAPYAGYTYYDSRPRLRAAGTIKVSGVAYPVSGEVWMDQQWGQPLQTGPATIFGPTIEKDYGWDWYQFQFDSGEELMLFMLRAKGKQILAGGTWIGKDCAYESLDASAFEVKALSSWKSPHTSLTYPQNWQITLKSKGLNFTATAVVADQEVYKHTQGNPLLASLAPAYWEGKVSIAGTGPNNTKLSGRGYAEAIGQ